MEDVGARAPGAYLKRGLSRRDCYLAQMRPKPINRNGLNTASNPEGEKLAVPVQDLVLAMVQGRKGGGELYQPLRH